jgi:hypothetical protein
MFRQRHEGRKSIMSLNLEQYAGSDYPVIDAGDYEVIVKLEKKWTKDNSKEFVNCTFIVRDDIEQKFKGGRIFDKIWRDTTNHKWFDLKKLGNMLVTQKGKEGYKTTFDECDECILYLNDATMIVTVEKKYDDYAEKEINTIKYLSYKPSKVGPYTKPAAETVTREDANLDKITVEDKDLPW